MNFNFKKIGEFRVKNKNYVLIQMKNAVCTVTEVEYRAIVGSEYYNVRIA